VDQGAAASVTLTTKQLQDIIQGAITGVLAAHPAPAAIPAPAPPAVPSYLKRPDRPDVDLGCNEGQWAFFLDEWGLYKRRCNLKAADTTLELRACCSAELKKELFDFVGASTLNTLDENALVAQIKTLAVKGKNKAVHRQEFYSMHQEPGQPIQAFVAKLRSKAEHCQFTLECTNADCSHQSNSYAESMVADQMVVGCCDKDIQGEILAKDAQLVRYQEKFDLIQALEEGKRAKSQLGTESSVAAHKSQYQRNQRQQKITGSGPPQQENPKPKQQENPKPKREPYGCSGCGSKDHGRGTRLPRATNCPAWTATCDHCRAVGHTPQVCRKRQTGPTPRFYDGSGHNTASSGTAEGTSYFFTFNEDKAITEHQNDHAFYEQLRADNERAWKQTRIASSRTNMCTKIILPHMEWIGSDGSFRHRDPRHLPKLQVQLSVLHDAHKNFGREIPATTLRNVHDGVIVNSCADTGAQTCASGLEILKVLNVSEKFLIPTSHRIIGVTQSCMDIAGVLLLKIEAEGRISRQVVYVSRNTKGFYLSEQAQIDLGVLPVDYPIANCFPPRSSIVASSDEAHVLNPTAPCGCLARSSTPPRPDQLPFSPTPENRDALEKWLLDYYGASAFNTCQHQQLPKMSGRPLDIHLREDAQPKAYHCPIPVPHHWKKQVKADLDRDVRLGIIEPVPPGTPTIWCSKMVVVPKKDGSPRRTVDLQQLNAATYRETHHTPSPFNQASVVPPHTKKTVLDAWNGYHSMPLSPAARDATTFITEWGRYRYLGSPQGFHAAGDGYTKRFDDITVDCKRKAKCIDDTVLWDTNIEKSFWHTVEYITTCNDGGIIFNPKKFHFAMDEVDFAGFTLSSVGIKPMKEILTAIKNFPTPTDITGARSWFGLINQVAYAFSMTSEMQPFRDLLKPGRTWFWDETLNNLFEKSKEAVALMVENGVRSFEIGRATCLATDWSKDGVGFVLLQKHCLCTMDLAPNCCKEGWRLVFAGSRFTTDAESRYAPVEGEALAVIDALEKCRMFILGCPNLVVAVDHKPLLKILGDRRLEDIANPRLFHLKEKSLLYRFSMRHVPGKWHAGPDACSRYPSPTMSAITSTLRQPATMHEQHLSLDVNRHVESRIMAAMAGSGYTDGIDIRAITWDRVKDYAARDEVIQSLTKAIQHGLPDNKQDLPLSLQPFWNVRTELSCLDGVPLYKDRIIVPAALRTEVLDSLHSAHQGVVGMKARARASVYWPGITGAITNRRAQCKICDRIGPSQPAEPLSSPPTPEYPFDQVVADYFSLSGIKYLVYADRYTGWVVIIKSQPGEADAVSLKKHLRMLFGVYGAPRELSTDGGPPFNSHGIRQFLGIWGVSHRLSSAYYAQSNGRAELAVKVAKRILWGNAGPQGNVNSDRVARALLQHRNTPLQGINLSPAQLLYGRTMRDCIPTLAEANKIRPEWQMVSEDRELALAKRNHKNAERYNEHTKLLADLELGNHVAVQNQTGPRANKWEKTGTVVEKEGNRQYIIRMDGSGRCSLRNRRFLKRIQPMCADLPLLAIDPPAMPAKSTSMPLVAMEKSPLLPPPYDVQKTPASVSEPPTKSPTPLTRMAFPHTPYLAQQHQITNQPIAPRQLTFEPPHDISAADGEQLAVGSDTKLQSDLPFPDHDTGGPRRSTRTRRPKRELSPAMTGKSHDYTDRN
jgi:hypothetical protein